MQIYHNPLASGQTITLSYKFKESDSWTSLAADSTQAVGDTDTTYTFPTGVNSTKISYKVTLATTDTSTTPTIKEFVARYTLYPETKFQWNLRILAKKPLKLADGTYDTRTGDEIRNDLETLIATAKLYTLTDIDGTTYTVLFHSLDSDSWVINQEDDTGATVPITLIEA